MPPARRDVQAMVDALFKLIDSTERATRLSKGASTLRVLSALGTHGPLRPSQIAHHQRVHPSLVTRQLQDLESAGYVRSEQDPADGRARLIGLTPAGRKEAARLEVVGLNRFALFVSEWDPVEVRCLTELLTKLETSKAAVATRERRAQGDPAQHS